MLLQHLSTIGQAFLAESEFITSVWVHQNEK